MKDLQQTHRRAFVAVDVAVNWFVDFLFPCRRDPFDVLIHGGLRFFVAFCSVAVAGGAG
jgi:hypothetical protein